MRAFYYLPVLAVVAACESDLEVAPAIVQWMEWPAEVRVATPFTVRLLVPFPGCNRGVFRPGIRTDQSAVTFAPYFLVKRENTICLPEAQQFDVLPFLALDTLETAPGLVATYARTFEMRGSAVVYAATPSPNAGDAPVRTFGNVTVRLSDPDTSRRNAAGIVTLRVDDLGCVRVQPGGSYYAQYGVVLEDQADTTGLRFAFARGYIHESPTPICGETRVFHLVSRN